MLEMSGKGFVEDMFPIMFKIWTTYKYRTSNNMNNELISIIKRKFEEHEETFDLGMSTGLMCLYNNYYNTCMFHYITLF